MVLGDNAEATKPNQVVIGSSDYNEILIDLGTSEVEITDGKIDIQGVSDSDSLDVTATRLNLGQLNSKAKSTDNDNAVLNVKSHSDGFVLMELESNTGAGKVKSTQRTVGTVDLQIEAAGSVVHDFRTDGDAVHSGDVISAGRNLAKDTIFTHLMVTSNFAEISLTGEFGFSVTMTAEHEGYSFAKATWSTYSPGATGSNTFKINEYTPVRAFGGTFGDATFNSGDVFIESTTGTYIPQAGDLLVATCTVEGMTTNMEGLSVTLMFTK